MATTLVTADPSQHGVPSEHRWQIRRVNATLVNSDSQLISVCKQVLSREVLEKSKPHASVHAAEGPENAEKEAIPCKQYTAPKEIRITRQKRSDGSARG